MMPNLGGLLEGLFIIGLGAFMAFASAHVEHINRQFSFIRISGRFSRIVGYIVIVVGFLMILLWFVNLN